MSNSERHWFLGDSCLVRYEDGVGGNLIRITGQWSAAEDWTKSRRYYLINYVDDRHQTIKDDTADDLASAIAIAEEWLP